LGACALTVRGKKGGLLLINKLSLLANEYLPGKRVFFIYTHKNGHSRFVHGLKANTEISYWCFKALKKHFPRVTFLRLEGEKDKRINKITSKDVVVGHPGRVYLEASKRTKKLIAFNPWTGHEDHSTSTGPHSVPKEVEFDYYKRAKSTILLTSEFNQREYLNQKRNFWHPFFQNYPGRLRVVHQPLDFSIFKRIKFEYTTSNFLYIGHFGHMKGVDQSKLLVQELNRTLHLFGAEGSRFNHLDAKQVSSLPSLADFFIQPGMWEGQCVSILEAAARGFIPVVSPDTGYPYDHPYLLKFGEHSYNLERLKALLKLSPQERKELGNHLYSQFVSDPNHNSWRKLTNVLVEEVKHLY
jgi:glycosyltransferase involved in cell wall biosynthesis